MILYDILALLNNFIKLNTQQHRSSLNQLRIALAILIGFPISTKHDVEPGVSIQLKLALTALLLIILCLPSRTGPRADSGLNPIFIDLETGLA